MSGSPRPPVTDGLFCLDQCLADHLGIKVAILPSVNRFSEWWDCEFRSEDGRGRIVEVAVTIPCALPF